MADKDIDITEQNWFCFVTDEASAESLKDMHANPLHPNFDVNIGNVKDAISALKEVPGNTLILIDITESENFIDEINELAEYAVENTHVIAIGAEDNVSVYKKLGQIGIDDYLVKPLNQNELHNTIRALFTEEDLDTGAKSAKCDVITILGATGGSGATTVATNLGWLLAEEQKATVCIIDMDIHFGHVSLALNLDQSQGLAEALINSDRLDEIFLKRLMIEVNENLFVLSAEQALDQELNYHANAFKQLLDIVARIVDICIIDMPHGVDIRHHEVLNASKEILILSDMTITSVRDTARLIKMINEMKSSANMKILGTQVPMAKLAEVSKHQFEQNVDSQIELMLPYDAKPMISAINQGEPLAQTQKNHKYTEAIRTIAQRLKPLKDQEVTKSWWEKIIKGE